MKFTGLASVLAERYFLAIEQYFLIVLPPH